MERLNSLIKEYVIDHYEQYKEKIDDKLDILQELPTSTMRVKVGEELASLPFAVFASGNLLISAKYIIDKIDCEELAIAKEIKKEPWFDKGKSILHFIGQEIKITLKNDKPIDHYILEAIFAKGDLTEQSDFVEIAEDTIKEEYNGNWQRFRNACDNLNQKIAKATDNKIPDFITYTTGKTGWCKINHKYL